MKITTNLFIILLLLISLCHAGNDESRLSDFRNFITCLYNDNTLCLEQIHDRLPELDFKQSIILRNALAHSMLTSTPQALDILEKIDEETARKGHSFIRDNYGADMVCAYMIDTNAYDRESFYKYYLRARSELEKAGKKGRRCLGIMSSSMEEIIYQEGLGKMTWGSKKYHFPN